MSFAWAKPYEPKTDLAAGRRAPAASAPGLRRDRRRLSGAAQPQLLLEFRRPRRIFLTIQIVTGIVLAMHYFASATARSIRSSISCATSTPAGCCATPHANGASFFFIVVYIHIFRGLFYGSY
jgi:ubiquinol-cytochrome c reductase cytochrome b subunit